MISCHSSGSTVLRMLNSLESCRAMCISRINNKYSAARALEEGSADGDTVFYAKGC